MARSSAAEARRRAAHEAGERGGDEAFAQYRAAVEGVQTRKRQPKPHGPGLELRAERVTRSGKSYIHTSGYYTRYERGYPMWDRHGQYVEMTMRGSGTASLARKPDVMFLINHGGLALARTIPRPGMDPTLRLWEDSVGGQHEAWLNPDRDEARNLLLAMEDGIVTEMSFAFTIPDGGGQWDDDFEVYQILAYDIDRGDVSAVNYGANPFTDISARSGEILAELEHLPDGAREEAARRLGVTGIEQRTQARERIVVGAFTVDPGASLPVRRAQWLKANLARRYVELAAETGLMAGELAGARLPWYEIRATPLPDADDTEKVGGEATDILIYDEIGGSYGVDDKQFARDLAGIETPQINLRINSPGGNVFDALAIASSIRHKSDEGFTITSYVDGVAASAASVIAVAADEVVAMPGAQFMIHRASVDLGGNTDDLRKLSAFTAKQDANIAEQYAAKAGGDASEWLAMMAEETWFLPQEALDAGLVDRMYSSGTRKRGERTADDPRLTRTWELTQYRYAGRENAPITQQRRAAPARADRGPVAASARNSHAEAGAFLQAVVDAYEAGTTQVPDDPAAVTVTNGSIGPAPTGRKIATIEALLAAEGGDLG